MPIKIKDQKTSKAFEVFVFHKANPRRHRPSTVHKESIVFEKGSKLVGQKITEIRSPGTASPKNEPFEEHHHKKYNDIVIPPPSLKDSKVWAPTARS
ncbi:hypothetical protein BG015_001389 [Linnemannia schmuckeri]|uniref:Uncharacterized protein n=1 Tax=Linnemannia schmuckeri TaxID=64567 RepID=A0A9P5S6A4_9FUNG|nr:hypothetical protein BG015_001389 [Linnemannia schmuckeri]